MKLQRRDGRLSLPKPPIFRPSRRDAQQASHPEATVLSGRGPLRTPKIVLAGGRFRCWVPDEDGLYKGDDRWGAMVHILATGVQRQRARAVLPPVAGQLPAARILPQSGLNSLDVRAETRLSVHSGNRF